jgi:hypothetical protein
LASHFVSPVVHLLKHLIMQPFAFQAEVEELQSEEARLDASIGYVMFQLVFFN